MVVTVGDAAGVGREGERMDVGDKKQPSYMDYVKMWLHIMDPSKLKVCRLSAMFCYFLPPSPFSPSLPPPSLSLSLSQSIQLRDPALWTSLHQLIYDEVIGSVLKIIRRLNLSATTTSSSSEEVYTHVTVGEMSNKQA